MTLYGSSLCSCTCGISVSVLGVGGLLVTAWLLSQCCLPFVSLLTSHQMLIEFADIKVIKELVNNPLETFQCAAFYYGDVYVCYYRTEHR